MVEMFGSLPGENIYAQYFTGVFIADSKCHSAETPILNTRSSCRFICLCSFIVLKYQLAREKILYEPR